MKSKIDNTEFKDRKRAEGTIVISAFVPIDLWNEWDKDCKKRFGDSRWIKMWNDHIVSKNYDIYTDLLERVKALETKLAEKEETTGKQETVKTFTKEL